MGLAAAAWWEKALLEDLELWVGRQRGEGAVHSEAAPLSSGLLPCHLSKGVRACGDAGAWGIGSWSKGPGASALL